MKRLAESKWQAPEAAERYAKRRFRNARAAKRDPRHVEALLEGCDLDARTAMVLDAPCGTGRLHPVLSRLSSSYVGLDVSAAMLQRVPGSATLCVGSLEALPFDDEQFDAVVSCRFLHHARDEASLARCIRELVRVSRAWIVVSFWDAASWHALRRRTGLRRTPHGKARRPLAKARLEALFRDAGAEITSYSHSLRFVSQQAFAAARKLRP